MGFTALAQFAFAVYLGIGQVATGYVAVGQVVLAYYGLARREEREMEARYGQPYRQYQARTPTLIPSPKAARSGRSVTGEEQQP